MIGFQPKILSKQPADVIREKRGSRPMTAAALSAEPDA
jgi:hypothetical protein